MLQRLLWLVYQVTYIYVSYITEQLSLEFHASWWSCHLLRLTSERYYLLHLLFCLFMFVKCWYTEHWFSKFYSLELSQRRNIHFVRTGLDTSVWTKNYKPFIYNHHKPTYPIIFKENILTVKFIAVWFAAVCVNKK